MKILISTTLLLITSFCFFSCGTPNNSSKENTDTEVTKTVEEKMDHSNEAVQHDGYSIKVLKGGIKSPKKELSSKVGAKDLTITYGSPSVKGRSIFGDESDQWGANDYDEAKNALKVTVSPKANNTMSETMEFAIKDGHVILMWDKLKIPFSIK